MTLLSGLNVRLFRGLRVLSKPWTKLFEKLTTWAFPSLSTLWPVGVAKAFGSRWRGDDHIYPGVKTGQPIRPDYVYTRLKTLALRAGLPAISVHDSRRSYINGARERKIPTETTAELVGHSSDRATKDYYHREVPPLDLQAAADSASYFLGEDYSTTESLPPSDELLG